MLKAGGIMCGFVCFLSLLVQAEVVNTWTGTTGAPVYPWGANGYPFVSQPEAVVQTFTVPAGRTGTKFEFYFVQNDASATTVLQIYEVTPTAQYIGSGTSSASSGWVAMENLSLEPGTYYAQMYGGFSVLNALYGLYDPSSTYDGGSASYGWSGGSHAVAGDFMARLTITPDSSAAAPTFSPAGSAISSSEAITISCATSGASIYYTTDGTTPTTSSTLYTGPVTITTTNTTLKAMAVVGSGVPSLVTSSSFRLIESSEVVETWTGTDLVTVYPYGTNTSPFATNPEAIVQTFTVPEGRTGTKFEFYFVQNDYSNYATLQIYEVSPTSRYIGTALSSVDLSGWVVMDNLSLEPGTYYAQMYGGSYSRLNSFGGQYSSGSTYDGGAASYGWSGGANAVAGDFKARLTVTPASSAAKPTFSPAGPYVTASTAITISCATTGASIYYTTDGSEPTTSSTLYTGPVTIKSMDTTLKAIAVVGSGTPSWVTSTNYTVMVPYGSATVDGDLSDWNGAVWGALNKIYDGTPSDIKEAYYAIRWQKNKVYVAVKVNDTAHKFSSGYGSWGTNDNAEFYIHTSATSTDTYYRALQDSAQQWVVGITGTAGQVWTSLGGDGLAMPASTGFSAAGSVDGDWIYYEVAMTPYEFFGGVTDEESVVSNLAANQVIRFDTCIVGNNGGETGTYDIAGYTGMLSADTTSQKCNYWDRIASHKLAAISGDANLDGAVNVSDLSLLAANYGTTSSATWAMGDFTGDGAVNVSDLSLLAANYGTGSTSSLSWADAYAQAFGTATSDAEDSSDDTASDDAGSSICSSLGLSLIVGLALMGLMMVKLEE